MSSKLDLRRTLGAAFFFSFLWWSFSDGSTYQLWLGAIIVLIATTVFLTRPRFEKNAKLVWGTALAKFSLYYIFQSIKGGVLVAKLAILPQSRIRSEFFDYRMRIPSEAVIARLCFASCLCVFPGTLSCGYRGDILVIHALDTNLLDEKAIRELESFVWAILSTQISER